MAFDVFVHSTECVSVTGTRLCQLLAFVSLYLDLRTCSDCNYGSGEVRSGTVVHWMLLLGFT